MATAYIGIGSNIGNRLAIIEQAIAMIEYRLENRTRVSPLIETEPWGFESLNPFLNVVLAIESNNSPLLLLKLLQEIEHAIDPSPHRDSKGNYIDRQIDIDLIAIDEVVIDTPKLTIPHPQMHKRRFVLEPMASLAPGWIHPSLGISIDQLLNQSL